MLAIFSRIRLVESIGSYRAAEDRICAVEISKCLLQID